MIVSQQEYPGGPQGERWAALGGSLASHSGSTQRGRVLSPAIQAGILAEG